LEKGRQLVDKGSDQGTRSCLNLQGHQP